MMHSEKLTMIGQMAADVAHEINNPLASILLLNRLVLDACPENSPMRQNAERIEHEVKRCQSIVRGLLDFARHRDPKAEPADLNELLRKTLALFENLPIFHNIEVVRNFHDRLPDALVDPAQLQQVFVNIIVNAVDAMERRGRLTITTRFLKETDRIEVEFEDTGCGMTDEARNRAFEPFYTTKKAGQGTGLGLSISLGIVQRHGGDLMVLSRKGEGSRFVITLPRERKSESCQ